MLYRNGLRPPEISLASLSTSSPGGPGYDFGSKGAAIGKQAFQCLELIIQAEPPFPSLTHPSHTKYLKDSLP